MKNITLIILVLSLSFMAKSQTIFYDASVFPLLGKISDATETRYERLPARLKDVSRPPIWDLSKCTAGFAIAGADKRFAWAKAYIDNNNRVIVYSSDVDNPVIIRYTWGDNSGDVNLFNNEGMPASPFQAAK